MNKNLLYLLLCFFPAIWLVSCNDDETINGVSISEVTPYTGVYRGKMTASIENMETDKMWQQVKVETTDDRVILRMEAFRVGDVNFGDIVMESVRAQEKEDGIEFYAIANLELRNFSQTNVEVKGTVYGDELNVSYTIRSVKIPTIYASMTGQKSEFVKSDSVAIADMTFSEGLVLVQPEIDNGNRYIYFSISDTIADTARIVLRPIFKLHDGCTSPRLSGDSLDFSSGPARMTVWAEDSIHRAIYTIYCQEVRSYPTSFEDWQLQPIQETDSLLTYWQPAGWKTSNAWIRQLKIAGLYARTYPYPVVPTTSRKDGDYAARLTTIRTQKAGHNEIPGLHGAELFLGNYIVDPAGFTGKSEYGETFDTQPVSVNGWYKYIPGKVYYENREQVADKQDSCSMIGVLYEVKSMNETITAEQIPMDPRIIALGCFETGNTVKNYTPFEFKFTYLDMLNSRRMYKLAVVFRSSKYGYQYAGAPGSELYIDEVSIIGQ